MSNADLLKKFMESRKETLDAILDRLKERLSAPGSSLVYRGYTPSFNDGDPCTHGWSYFGFGPGWLDDTFFVKNDGVVLDRYDDMEEIRDLGVTEPDDEHIFHSEEDCALIDLVQIFWDDIADAVPSTKIRWAGDSLRTFDVTNCGGRFYVDTEGNLCVTQEEYCCY